MDQTAFMIGFTVMSLASLAIYAKGSKAPASTPSHAAARDCALQNTFKEPL
ncbi:hypothetical protein [Sphingomonas sp. BAUL-RG-20F-R05-02]|uniref:hypothetical protein n=1 Tax=Sphingomonas sp. BAUL-RG-20F-R05-02 TaxID=2914830 RepID=UPI001F580C5A|nr:hypothetical protein [Sphingomonas sp. BAUL-RG-20F-R05-02]